MNTEYIENFRLIGFEVKVCKSMKEFIQEIKDRSSHADFTGISFKKYMNDELNGYWDCISDGWTDEDACIFIGYKDGTKYSFLPALGVEGKFKETGIEWAILSDGYGYTVYNDDLSVEWENIELDEIEEEAIKRRIPVETLKLQKKLLSEQEQSEQSTPKPEQSEQKQEQEQSEQSTSEPEQSEQSTSEPEQSEQSTSEPEQSEQSTSEPEQSEPEEIKVEDLYLSIRAYNALKRANIDSIQDFFSLSPEEIKMKIGEKNATEVILALHEMGIEKPEGIPQKEGNEEPKEVPGASEQERSEQEQSKQEQSEQGTSERKIIYRIDILKALKEAGYNQGRIKREKLLNGSAVDKIRAGSTDISLKTLSTICNLLNAEPGDILAMA